MGSQPAGVEETDVTVLPLDPQAALGVHPGDGGNQVFRDVDDFQHLLASHAVDALGAGAVIA
ncbi:hypothetical protein D3C86_2114690 [compost metagenome]